ncbi:F-box/WD repeat-containing protein 5-like [Anneissia japonica]|uniref:F-box/WD repeat-containing protein 5-like n=1 Tax=Anneissia japonica TaxID=1529436 RepID=UPI0014258420|nr:F-box/WD repeat-containing protein 5-like [Anneissia japonica]
MATKPGIWLCLPDSLILHIFTFLSSRDLQRCAQTCKSWLRISQDELLWKLLLYREWKIDSSIKLANNRRSYRREFKRLAFHTPKVQYQVLREHTDQVLHVSFSHNGKMFSSCSKDGTIKVWRTGPPASIRYSQSMKELFRWQYTQFSQFNATDTLLLVSGVHFGPNSTSGEIAVFNIKEEFYLQARVLNKPYDIFGCWLNNSYLLSGNLHYLGHLSSCSALWLNKAMQEVDSEQESVVMRIFKFLNINASTIRSIMVANCSALGRGLAMDDGKDMTAESTGVPSSSDFFHSSSESEIDNRTNAWESDLEGTGEIDHSTHHDGKRTCSEGDINQSFETGILHHSESEPCFKAPPSPALSTGEVEPRRSVSPRIQIQGTPQTGVGTKSSSLKRDVSYVSSTPPDLTRKSLRTNARGMYTVGVSPAAKLDPDSCYQRLWMRVREAEMRRGGHLDYDILKILIDGVDPEVGMEECQASPSGSQSRRSPAIRSPRMESPSELANTQWPRNGDERDPQEGPSTSRQAFREGLPPDCPLSLCSSTDTMLSSPDTDLGSRTFATDSASASDVIRAWGKKFTFGSTDSLDDEPAIQYSDRRFINTELDGARNIMAIKNGADENYLSSSSFSDSHEAATHLRIKRRIKRSTSKEIKHLIFTMGSKAYTPHQIGIKKIRKEMCNTLKGPLGKGAFNLPRQDDAAAEEIGDEQGIDFDKVDHVIELNGHAIGMALSPDQRFLYVNCRCWPPEYRISDPLAPPPIAQEIEIRVYDLVDLTEVKRFHGHKAYSPNDEFNFIFLDVSDQYVASGAEDKHAYIWDTHYGILIGRLSHNDVVNSVAFNPLDPEMLVTASDDNTIKIWTSRNQFERQTTRV